MSSPATRGIGDNRPPVTPPTEDEFLADLKARYPDLESKFKELEDAFNAAPAVIKDDEASGKVQDLYRTMVEFASDWDEARAKEKKPWDKIGKIVQNFFVTPIEKLNKKDVGYAPLLRKRVTIYGEEKAEAARIEAAKQAEAERAESERLRKEAEAAEARRIEADRLAAEARQREEKARAEEEAAKERRRVADEAAERARAEEKRLEAERKERERAEKEKNAEAIRSAKGLLKEAEGLFEVLSGDEDAEPDPRLEKIVLAGGEISKLLVPVTSSHFTGDEQRDAALAIADRAREIYKALSARLDAKERKKRAAAEKKREAEEAAAAEVRRKAREADEARAEQARKDRERAEADAARARQDAKDARKDVRAAQGDQDDAADEARAAEREGGQLGKQADKVERRADRLDNKLSTSSDADMSRTRGNFSVGSLSGRWEYRVVDRDALVKTLGILGPYINPDAVDAGLTKFMRQHQGEWADQRENGIVSGKVDGVVFDWVKDSRIV